MIDNKTIRKVIMLNKLLPSGSPTYENREAEGAVANFTTNTVQPFVSLDCEILPIQEGTGTPSPSNPRPISGTDELMLTHTTYRTAETYTFDLGQTVYGGSADVVTGVLTVTHGYHKYTNISTTSGVAVTGGWRCNFACPVDDINRGKWAVQSAPTFSMFDGSKPLNEGGISKGYGSNEYTVIVKNATSKETADATLEGLELVYELATPTDFTFTGQPINSYLGVNNLWTEAGDTKVTYKYKTGEGGSSTKKYLPIFYDLYGNGCRHL